MRIDEGTITGWDTWWRVGATSESDWNLLIVTVANHPDSLNANVGVPKMRPDYSEMDREIFLEKNSNPTDEEIVTNMNGNICRCGTYTRIKAAIKTAAKNI